jgi:hypothetical protein
LEADYHRYEERSQQNENVADLRDCLIGLRAHAAVAVGYQHGHNCKIDQVNEGHQEGVQQEALEECFLGTVDAHGVLMEVDQEEHRGDYQHAHVRCEYEELNEERASSDLQPTDT